MTEHICVENWPRSWRLLLAKLADDGDAIALIHNEIGSCVRCWRLLSDHQATNHAADMALQCRGVDAAIANVERVVANELGVPMPELEWPDDDNTETCATPIEIERSPTQMTITVPAFVPDKAYAAFEEHVAIVESLAAHGITPPQQWLELRERFRQYQQSVDEKPRVAHFVNELLSPKGKDIAAMRADALAEVTATTEAEALLTHAVRIAFLQEMQRSYSAVAEGNYRAAAKRFNDTADAFGRAVATQSPDGDPSLLLRLVDGSKREAWLQAEKLARELDELVGVLVGIARLIGAAPDAEDDELAIALSCEPGKVTRRTVWEAWRTDTGRCGRWWALHRAGVKVRAHRDPKSVAPYRKPERLQQRWIPSATGGHERYVYDPETGEPPKGIGLETEWVRA